MNEPKTTASPRQPTADTVRFSDMKRMPKAFVREYGPLWHIPQSKRRCACVLCVHRSDPEALVDISAADVELADSLHSRSAA